MIYDMKSIFDPEISDAVLAIAHKLIPDGWVVLAPDDEVSFLPRTPRETEALISMGGKITFRHLEVPSVWGDDAVQHAWTALCQYHSMKQPLPKTSEEIDTYFERFVLDFLRPFQDMYGDKALAWNRDIACNLIAQALYAAAFEGQLMPDPRIQVPAYIKGVEADDLLELINQVSFLYGALSQGYSTEDIRHALNTAAATHRRTLN